MEIQIGARNNRMAAEDLRTALSKELGSEPSVTLSIRRPDVEFRGIDPTILVATVSAVGTALGTVIGGLLRIAQQSKSGKIVIQGRQGQRLELPADYPATEIDELIDKVRELDTEALKISLD
jgi:hypothetical protein